ncbi:hypothetical protein H0H93_009750 [Arthromyces matolae]|nr:hypothetical protein H0H93_009750 [Arthromyces matolae]
MTESDSSNQTIKAFPTPTLVNLSIASCFIASASLVTSFLEIGKSYAYFIVPSMIGFIATIPYHVHMFKSAKEHRHAPSPTNPFVISNDWILYNFLLVTLWTVIFKVNILFCVGEGTPAIILTTILSGLEWITLLLLAVFTVVEVSSSNSNLNDSETQSLLPGNHTAPRLYLQNLIYFASYTLCTLALIIAVDVALRVVLVYVILFFLTAPHHMALYISSARPDSSFKFFSSLSRPTHIAYGLLLCVLWCAAVPLGILMPYWPYQSILLGIFGGLECIVVIYLFKGGIHDALFQGQIKL